MTALTVLGFGSAAILLVGFVVAVVAILEEGGD